jgi:hypothetical protein
MADPINPVLADIRRTDVISDPFVRELYFGSPDYEGLIAGSRRAAQKYLDLGPTMRKTAGLSPLEQAAMQRAYGGIGGYEPYLQAQEQALLGGMGLIGQERGLLNEAIEATRRGGEIQQPYFSQAEQQYGAGLGDLIGSLGQRGPSAREFQRAALEGFDPRAAAAYSLPSQVMQPFIQSAREQTGRGLESLMGGAAREQMLGSQALRELQRGVGQEEAARRAGLRELRGGAEEARMIARETGRATFDPRDTARFYDPFEQQVVQQTIEDIMKGGAKEDIAARARDIQTGGQSAFGSRARLSAGERQSALGRGLGEALANIRSGGFQRAQQAALGEFGRQQSALERSGGTLAGLGQQLGAGLDRFGAGQLGGSQLLAGQIGKLGTMAAERGAQEQQARFGAAGAERAIGSDLAGLSQQALETAMRESQFGRGALERAGEREAGYGQTLMGARRGYAGDMLGLGQARGDLARGTGSALAGYGQQLGGIGGRLAGFGSQLGGLGQTYQKLGQQERNELMGYGQQARRLMDTQYGREYDYAEQQRQDPMKAMQFMQSFAPQYQSGQAQVTKEYGMPIDPLGLGVSTGIGTYSGLRNNPSQNSYQNDPKFQEAYRNFINSYGGQGNQNAAYGGGYS